MNNKLVDSLVRVIESLPEAERNLLQDKLARKQNWAACKQRLYAIHRRIRQQHSHQGPSLSTENLVGESRELRDQQLMEACFPESSLP